MILLRFFTLCSFLGLSISCSSSASYESNPAIALINKEALTKVIAENTTIQLVDVRRPSEYADGFIEPAININYFDSDFATQFGQFDKETPLYLYCKSGGRSNKAAHLLAEEGFTKIYDLEGGYLQWQKQ